jgi:protein-S-isoprenylcysteine O-methyltransferase Ste14
MLWVRGLIFTVLVPGIVGGWLPYSMSDRRPRGGLWMLGWVLVAIGAAIYFMCLLRFLASGGTPSIWFLKPIRMLLGEEPPKLVNSGLYKRSRNPMYVGVLTAIFGQAIAFASWPVAEYGLFMVVVFNLVVHFIEEPHLRAKQGAGYDEYCRRVPRWFGRAMSPAKSDAAR